MSHCATPSATKPESQPLPEIRVNGVALDESLLAQELQYHRAKNFESVVHKAGQALVIRQLLIDELKKDLAVDEQIEDEEEAVQALLEKNVTSHEPSEEDCNRYFENNPDRFMSQPLLQVEHILLAAPGDDIAARDEAKEQALSIIGQLKADPGLFAALAEGVAQ